MASVILFFLLVGVAFCGVIHNERTAQFEGKVWLGKWESTDRRFNYEAFATVLGHGHPGARDPHHKNFIKFWKEDDHFHLKVTVPEISYKMELEFTMGLQSKSTFNGTSFTYTFSEDGDILKSENFIPSRNLTIFDTYRVNGTEMEVHSKVGDIESTRWYKKDIQP
ncbi:SAHS5 [Ramazzottius varieornatus]|uniref:SAHS5 n=1 Tax=Ramazzottius varieornatus TaxID=947166 RepID=A0A1D1UUS6_RAMVA|nr:SAHS5 [Ramazzottius varieornatus]